MLMSNRIDVDSARTLVDLRRGVGSVAGFYAIALTATNNAARVARADRRALRTSCPIALFGVGIWWLTGVLVLAAAERADRLVVAPRRRRGDVVRVARHRDRGDRLAYRLLGRVGPRRKRSPGFRSLDGFFVYGVHRVRLVRDSHRQAAARQRGARRARRRAPHARRARGAARPAQSALSLQHAAHADRARSRDPANGRARARALRRHAALRARRQARRRART